jgi:hypothetical protein
MKIERSKTTSVKKKFTSPLLPFFLLFKKLIRSVSLESLLKKKERREVLAERTLLSSPLVSRIIP